MSGAKRRTKYRKHVTQDFNDSERVPNEGEVYAQVGQSHGGNIFEILTSDGEKTLARLPTKFRKLIWVKRNDFVIVGASTVCKAGVAWHGDGSRHSGLISSHAACSLEHCAAGMLSDIVLGASIRCHKS